MGVGSDKPLADYVAGLDEEGFRQPILNGIKKILDDAGDEAPGLADELGELILNLNTGVGKQSAFALIARFVPTSSAVRDLAVQLTQDDAWEARLAGVQALAVVPTDTDARKRLEALLNDPHPSVRMFCIEQFPALRALPTGANGAALRVIPDDDQRDESLRLLADLEQAIYFLEETDLEDAQRRILDDEMLPTISELRDIFNGTASDKPRANSRRHDGIMSIGRLKGAANAVGLATNLTAAAGNADEATENVKRAVAGLAPIATFLMHLAGRIA